MGITLREQNDFENIVKTSMEEIGYIFCDGENKNPGKVTYRLLYLTEKGVSEKIKKIYISQNIYDEMLLEKRNAPFWMNVDSIELESLWGRPVEINDGIKEIYEDNGGFLPYCYFQTKEVILFELENGKFALGAC